MNFKNPKIQKIVTAFLIFAVFVPSILVISTISFQPKKAEAAVGIGVPVEDFVTEYATWKEVIYHILKEIAMVAARRMINQITQSTINWINTGRWSNPFFVEHPDQFFKDIMKFEVTSLINSIAYDSLHFPFGRSIASGWVNEYNNPYYGASTWSKIFTDAAYNAALRRDFYVGGWNAFYINTQYQDENYVGYLITANEDLGRKLSGLDQTNIQKVNKTLDRAGGFLEPKMCPTNVNPKYNNGTNEFKPPAFNYKVPLELPWPACADQVPFISCTDEQYKDNQEAIDAWELVRAGSEAEWKKNNTCPGGLVTTTPGAVIGNQIGLALGSKIHQAELGAALGNSFGAVFNALLDKYLYGPLFGLLGAGGANVGNEDPGKPIDPRSDSTGFPANPNGGGTGGGPGQPPGGGPGQPPGGTCTASEGIPVLTNLRNIHASVSGIAPTSYVSTDPAIDYSIDSLITAVNGVKNNNWISTITNGQAVNNYLNNAITGLQSVRAALQTPEDDSSRNALISANVNATLQALNATINLVVNDAACGGGTTPPPGQPPAGTPQNPGEWRTYFFSILDQQAYPRITQAAMQATRGGLRAKGADWQFSSTSGDTYANCQEPNTPAGNLRPRIYVYGADGVTFDPYSIDVGSCFAGWGTWTPNY